MDKEQPKVTFPNSQAFTDNAKEAIQRGIAWLHNWYSERAKMIRSNGEPFMSAETRDKIGERLSNIKIFGGDQVVENIQEGIANGELHPTPLGVESWKDDKYLEDLREHTKDVDHMGATWQNIEEKPIYLNEEHIKANQKLGYTSKDKLIGVIGPIDELAVHEATHAADIDPQNSDRVGYITDTDILSSYRNQPREIYARLNNLRYRLQVDPTKVFTVEEVAELRKKCEQDMRYFEQKRNDPTVDIQQLVKEPGRLYDDMLFDRFSDEQICRLLNDVAQQRPIEQLDELHQQNQKPEVSPINYASVVKQQRHPQENVTLNRRGIHMG